MKYLILSGNPKSDGLCSAVTENIVKGAQGGGAEVTVVTPECVERCRCCADGWGPCREEHRCAFDNDGFSGIQQAVRDADALCIISPVYWGETAEGLKCLIDRLRRCEFGSGGALAGKQVLLVASPGGSGNGMLTCLEQLDRFCRHTGAVIFDYIGINRWNSDYKAQAAFSAAFAMATGRKNGETV